MRACTGTVACIPTTLGRPISIARQTIPRVVFGFSAAGDGAENGGHRKRDLGSWLYSRWLRQGPFSVRFPDAMAAVWLASHGTIDGHDLHGLSWRWKQGTADGRDEFSSSVTQKRSAQEGGLGGLDGGKEPLGDGGEQHRAGNDKLSALRLLSGAFSLPHPDKQEKGGEDAHFICENGLAVGVADGVGGWADLGVDPGQYSRELMSKARSKALENGYTDASPLKILEHAHAKTTARGSTTACIMCLGTDRLFAANLGDSGFMVVRNGRIVFMSPSQQHDFNFPYQIGSADSSSDPPSAAMSFNVEVQPGDILVAGTDGLLDNVFPEETAAIVSRAKERGFGPRKCAELVGSFARSRAEDKQVVTPFAKGAQKTGYFWQGGKMDDITVVVSFVVAQSKL